MSNVWRIHDVSPHRSFNSGQLLMSYVKIAGFDNRNGLGGRYSKIVPEPLSDEDKAIIGDTPIPPLLAKVDL